MSDSTELHDTLVAATMAGVPIELGHAGESGEGTIDGLATMAKLAALKELPESRWPDRYHAAHRVYEHTGKLDLVLDGLTHRRRSATQLATILRASWIYLIILALVGYMGLVFYSLLVAPWFDSLRADMALGPIPFDAPRADPIVAWLPTALVVAPIALTVTLLALWLTGGIAGWSARLGGASYIRDQAASVAMNLIASLLSRGVPATEAIPLACNLIGTDESTRRRVESNLRGRSLDASSGETLHRLATHHAASAHNRIGVLKIVSPILLTALIGGTGVLVYSVALFYPLVSLIHDLALPWGDS